MCVCVRDVFPSRTPLPVSLLCAALLSWSLCCKAAPVLPPSRSPSLSVSASEFRFLEGMLPLQRADGKGSSPLLELTPRPTCKAALTCVMQGHQTASSLSAWLLLSLAFSLSHSVCVSASLPLPLPPSSFFLSQYSTDTAPPPASLISRIRYSFKKHTLLGSAPRLRSHRERARAGRGRAQQTEGEGGRAGDSERVCTGRYCMDENNRGILMLQTYMQTHTSQGRIVVLSTLKLC